MQHNSDYYREEAAKYRELADMTKDAVTKQELLELAAARAGIAGRFTGQAGNEQLHHVVTIQRLMTGFFRGIEKSRAGRGACLYGDFTAGANFRRCVSGGVVSQV